jgi:CMP-N,N'-diacetyllegionaminic acid synthase
VGKPFLAYTAETALNSKYFSRVILSIEDQEISDIGMDYGLVTPFTRPNELAKDETPSLDVIQHAVKSLEEIEGYVPDVIVVLQPTLSLRETNHIDEAIEIFLKAQMIPS